MNARSILCVYRAASRAFLNADTFTFFVIYLFTIVIILFFSLNASSKSFRATLHRSPSKNTFFFRPSDLEIKIRCDCRCTVLALLLYTRIYARIHMRRNLLNRNNRHCIVYIALRPSVENYISKRINRLERYII